MNSLSEILSSTTDQFLNDVRSNTQHTTDLQTPMHESQHLHSDSDPLSETQKKQLKTMIYTMKDQLDAMLRLLNGQNSLSVLKQENSGETTDLHTGERIIEGVFTGEHMVGADGKEYPVPPNYASKSKLVEGDMMKLTITNHGRFIYKQIAPIDRQRLIGELTVDPAIDQWSVQSNGKQYKILTASVTFYKGKSGDEVIFLVPKDTESSWGAVENIIHK